ncbi:MAG: alpha/beta hydrolase [Pseudomonadota bacterium]
MNIRKTLLAAGFFVLVLAGCGGGDAAPPLPVPVPSPTAFLGELKHVQVGTVNYGYYRFGRGRPLVLINAFGMTTANWGAPLLRALGERYEVTAFDNRGMGHSPDTGPDFYTVEDMADSTVAFMAAIGLNKPDILGWSLGGETALAIGVRHGNRVDRIISVAGDAGSPKTIPPTPEFMAVAAQPDPPLQDVLSILFPADQMDKAAAWVAGVAEMPANPSLAGGRNRQLAAFAAWSESTTIWDAIPTIRNPALFINGTEDLSTPVENAVTLASRLPGSWLMQVTDAGHAVLFQEQERCLKMIDAFLAR